MVDRVVLRAIADAEFDRAVEIDKKYLSAGRATLTRWRSWCPELFHGAHVDGALVGVCYPRPSDEETLTLEGIAVVFERWRQGISSALLRDFEAATARAGFRRIDLGSAPDGPTEGFHLKNGYQAVQIVLSLGHRGATTNQQDLPRQPEEISEDGGVVRLRFNVEEYLPAFRDELRDACEAQDAIFIFAKTVGS
ncbi:MAG: GNAT family N-acetyltransferase [Gemmatimonadetes bacterium]|nr:GNAT family N-acetyltransferase [Gemmatimonadota bacterium]